MDKNIEQAVESYRDKIIELSQYIYMIILKLVFKNINVLTKLLKC